MFRSLLIGLWLALAGAIGWVSTRSLDDHDLRSSRAYALLDRVGHSLEAQVERTVEPARTRTDRVARDPRTLRAYSAGKGALTELANEVIRTSGELDTLAFYDASGEILAINTVYADGSPVPRERIEKILRADFSDRVIIQGCVRDDTTTSVLEFQTQCDITPAYFDSIGLSVAYSVPVVDPDGTRVGVVSARLDFRRLHRILTETYDSPLHGIYFIGEDGRYFDEEILRGAKQPPIAVDTLAQISERFDENLRDVAFYDATHDAFVSVVPVSQLDTMAGGSIRVLLLADGDWVALEARAEQRLWLTGLVLLGLLITFAGAMTRSFLRERALRVEIEDALESSEEAHRSRDDFLANIDHEIRTPMTAIIGYAEQLRDERIESLDHERTVDLIEKNGRMLLQVIGDLLDHRTLFEGTIPLDRRPARPARIAESVVETITARARDRGLDLTLTVDPHVPDRLLLDPARLQQILFILTKNAVKFTQEGSVAVHLDHHPRSSELVATIRDTGVGIDPSMHERIFEPFRQGDSSSTRRFGGMGMGLAIARRLARAHGGEIDVESAIGEGSTFTVTIAVAPDPSPQAPPSVETAGADSASPSETTAPSALAGLRVLVAEDGPDNQAIVVRLLEKAGIEVTLVEDGEAAVQSAIADLPDAILMDIQMPRLDGVEATERLRSLGFTRPIIAMTAHSLESQRHHYLASGCNEVLNKPYRREQLYGSLARHTGRVIAQT